MQIFEAVIEAYNFNSSEDYTVFHQYYQSAASAEAGIGARQLQIAPENDWANGSRGDSFYACEDVEYVAYIRKIDVLP